MQVKVTFEYAVIRLVPRVEREEFFNIGVILFSKPKKFLGIKFQIDEHKLAAFSKEIEQSIIEEYLGSWRLICRGDAEGGVIASMDLPSRFRWLVAARSTIIQSSKTHSGLCTSPELVLEELFEKYVL